MTSRRLALAVVAIAAPTAVASAAVVPTKGLYTSGGEGGAGFSYKGTKLAKNATAPSAFKCNKFNAVIPKAIPVSGGAFSYSGKLKGQPGRIVFKGHWTTSTTVKGTAKITKGSCSSKLSFKATYVNPAMPPIVMAPSS